MLEAVRIMARYNRYVNKQLFPILEGLEESVLKESVGSFFDSILGLANHILLSELAWLASMQSDGVKARALGDQALVYDDPGFGNQLYTELAPLWRHQQEVDRIFVELTSGFTEENGRAIFSRTNRAGTTYEYRVDEILMHVLNHATHHRGQISQILDERGIENDYSNLVSMLQTERRER